MTQVPVTVDLKHLHDGSVPLSQLEEAFGPSSLGIIIIEGLPEKYAALRRKVLSYSSYLANLPQEILETLEQPKVNYLIGWSLGKETLKSGQYDTLKGSYYINCGSFWHQHSASDGTTLSDGTNGTGGTRHDMPEYTAPSIWPDESALAGFRESCEELCNLVIDTAVLVAQACDRFGEKKVDGYRKGCLEHVVRTSKTTKARLLHYFPGVRGSEESSDGNQTNGTAANDQDDWCATHLDHGCLTGLTSAMYVNESEEPPLQPDPTRTPAPLSELPSSPDPKAGLYICSRSGEVTQCKIPRDCLAFQTGEALELMTKGKFKAVPHFVRGVGKIGKGDRVSRNTLAVFTQPNLEEIVDEERGVDFGTFAKETVDRNT